MKSQLEAIKAKAEELQERERDVQARETVMSALERKLGMLEDRERQLKTMTASIQDREERLQAASSRFLEEASRLESDSQKYVAHSADALEADVLPTRRVPASSSSLSRHVFESPRAIDNSARSRVTVDVVGNAASNILRGIVLGRKQSLSLLNELLVMHSDGSSLLIARLRELQSEFDELEGVLSSHRDELFGLHQQVERCQKLLQSADLSSEEARTAEGELLRLQGLLQELLARLLETQQQQMRWDRRVNALATGEGNRIMGVDYDVLDADSSAHRHESASDGVNSSLYDTPVSQRSAPRANTRDGSGVRSQAAWSTALAELGIPQTPRR
jgi:DNA repair exonuclease SbcCD ATPase subunit